MGVTVVHSLGHLIVPVVKFPFVPPKQSISLQFVG